MSKKFNILYGQSGGPTSAINASCYGVIKQAQANKEVIKEVYLAKNGIDGIINDNLVKASSIDHHTIDLLLQTPGAFLGSCRHKLPPFEEDETIYNRVLEIFKKYEIHAFFYNGGNDSMDTCNKLSKFLQKIGYECQVIGIPKTIDNDLPITDHTPGFGSAAKYIANTFAEISYDGSAYPKGRINIVEIMGRNAGWLTAASALATSTGYGPDYIYLPEVPFDEQEFVKKAIKTYEEKGKCMIAVSEGIKDKDGKFIADQGVKDAFGHAQMGGVASYLTSLISSYPHRAIELSLIQRSASYLGSRTDIEEAIQVGRHAVEFALKGVTDKMITILRKSSMPYEVEYSVCNLTDVADVEKKIPLYWINDTHDNVNFELIKYLEPLVLGENKVKYHNGLIELAKFYK